MQFTQSDRILLTSALPYANGDIHLGHLLEYIQTDIFARFLRLTGHDVVYVCGDDAHGTPIWLKARERGISPEQSIAEYHQRHIRDFTDFHIEFDCYHTTHSPENRRHVYHIYEELCRRGYIYRSPIEQLYCAKEQMFLPDRLIRGQCPHADCGAVNQYGDICEVCGRHYDPSQLINPICAVCGTTPTSRTSDHLFFRLSDFQRELTEWTSSGTLQSEVQKSLANWLQGGLRAWDISRDSPYFGFSIPGDDSKYFYVWLDAPVGYIAATECLCLKMNRTVDDYWRDPNTRIFHFIGKDITYFHTLFWPAMLMGAGYNLPAGVFVHGFLTVDGQRMSKSRGTFLTARAYLAHLDAQYLRYYFASKLTAGIDDINFNLEEFTHRVNAELVNRIVNLGSRSASILTKHLGSILGSPDTDNCPCLRDRETWLEMARQAYTCREYGKAIRTVLQVVDEMNKYMNETKPWELVQADPERARTLCTTALQVFSLVSLVLKPTLPKMAVEIEHFLRIPPQWWHARCELLPRGHMIGKFPRLIERIDESRVAAMVAATHDPGHIDALHGNRKESLQ